MVSANKSAINRKLCNNPKLTAACKLALQQHSRNIDFLRNKGKKGNILCM